MHCSSVDDLRVHASVDGGVNGDECSILRHIHGCVLSHSACAVA